MWSWCSLSLCRNWAREQFWDPETWLFLERSDSAVFCPFLFLLLELNSVLWPIGTTELARTEHPILSDPILASGLRNHWYSMTGWFLLVWFGLFWTKKIQRIFYLALRVLPNRRDCAPPTLSSLVVSNPPREILAGREPLVWQHLSCCVFPFIFYLMFGDQR